MKKPIKKYKVIQTSIHDYGDGNIQKYEKTHYTKGVSEAQARSRVMHRLGYNQWNCIVPWYGDGFRTEIFKAEEIID
jgi:hypothetical protein